MNKKWKILGAVYLAINTLFLAPAVQYSLKIDSMEEALRDPVYAYPFYGDVMEWYTYLQLTGTHWALALFFLFYCAVTLDFSKRYSKIATVLLFCLLIINIYFNWQVANLYTPFL